MKNRTFIVLVVLLILGLGVALGGGVYYLSSTPNAVQAAALVQTSVDRSLGVLVGGVVADSPAAKAGVVRGDIILELNGKTVNKLTDLMSALKDLKTGETIVLKVLHGDEIRNLSLTVGDKDGSPYLGLNPAVEMPFGFGKKARSAASVPGKTSGAKVTEVVAGSPAEKAGLKVGDVIVSVGGKSVDTTNDLATIIAGYKPGDSVKLAVQRTGQTNPLEIQVTLGESPTKAGQAYLGITYQLVPQIGSKNLPGNPPTPKTPRAGVVVTAVAAGSPAEKAGIKVKDVITQANGTALTTADDLVKIVKASKVGDKLTLQVTRSGEANPLTIEVVLGENPSQGGQAYLGLTFGRTNWGFDRRSPVNPLPAPKTSGSNS